MNTITDWPKYSIQEAVNAFEFYILGPIDNGPLRETLKILSQYLVNVPECTKEQSEIIDELLEQYYLKFNA